MKLHSVLAQNAAVRCEFFQMGNKIIKIQEILLTLLQRIKKEIRQIQTKQNPNI